MSNPNSRPMQDLKNEGLLWLINRVVFHPRGFALALELEDKTGEVIGWQILGDGTEVYTFSEADDDDCFRRAKEFLASLQA